MDHPQRDIPVFRFAPSPNGALHLGHALSALTNADFAGRTDGRLLVRIEDIDRERCTPALEAAVLDDLRWLGLRWEEPVRRQSEHFADYRGALDRLAADGLIYPAFLSRGAVRAHLVEAGRDGRRWPHDPDGAPHYPGLDRTLSDKERRARMASGAPYAWRLDMGAALARIAGPLVWREASGTRLDQVETVAADAAAWGDAMIARKDVPTSYHLSVVVDDALQGVTHVVRGRDLYQATSVHRLLQRLLGLAEPLYHHHRLILDASGRKLSKSGGADGLAALRVTGATPDDVRRTIGLDPAGDQPAL